MKQLHTHKSLSKLLDVSETTIKSYRRKFPGCLPVASSGKPIQFTDAAVKVATRIRDFFATGMSVVEVHQRLSKEFDWITLGDLQKSKPETVQSFSEITPELTIGVSNMAKSMVTMTGQQKTILERVKGIEHVLDELGVQGIHLGEQEREKALQAQRNKEERLEERLTKVDVATQNLANNLALLAHQFQAFVAQVSNNQEILASQNVTSAHVQQDQASHNHGTVAPVKEKSHEQVAVQANAIQSDASQPSITKATIVPFEKPAVKPSSLSSSTSLATPLAMQGEQASEPSRAFFTMPLVVQHGDGMYSYATGRGKGRFCLNDLKAILVHGFVHPYHFVLDFEELEKDWWLQVYQPEQQEGQRIGLLLAERMAKNGISVVEVSRLQLDGRNVPPVEISTVLERLL